jgi:hypothetical protein
MVGDSGGAISDDFKSLKGIPLGADSSIGAVRGVASLSNGRGGPTSSVGQHSEIGEFEERDGLGITTLLETRENFLRGIQHFDILFRMNSVSLSLNSDSSESAHL